MYIHRTVLFQSYCLVCVLTCRLTISQVLYLRDGGGLSVTADPVYPRGTYETAAERNLFILDIGYTIVISLPGGWSSLHIGEGYNYYQHDNGYRCVCKVNRK